MHTMVQCNSEAFAASVQAAFSYAYAPPPVVQCTSTPVALQPHGSVAQSEQSVFLLHLHSGCCTESFCWAWIRLSFN